MGLLFLFMSLVSPMFRHPDRLAALDDAAFVPDFAPRWYMEAAPPLPALAKRQGESVQACSAGLHSCLELGPVGADVCCQNDQYCVLNTTWQPACCALGSDCSLSCAEDKLYCNATITSTVTLPATVVTGDATDSISVPLTVIPTDIPAAACCPRPCNSSSFLCQETFGGQCCPYGGTCGTGGICLFGPTTTAMPTIVTPVPSGCTTSQITCTDASGCCNIGSTCTWQQMGSTMSPACAPNVTVTDSGGDGGLSAQARAGIGAGVAIAAAIVIGLLTWFCVRRRSARSHSGGGSSGATAAMAGMGAGGGGGAMGMRHMSRGGGGDGEVSESLMPTRIPPTHYDSTARTSTVDHEYFGADAVAGPYTEDVNEPPAPALSPGGREGGVPVQPRGPDDILAPIEIDSRIRGLSFGSRSGEAERDMMMAGQRKSNGAREATPARDGEPEQTSGPFELYGSPGSPPLSPPFSSFSSDYFPHPGPPPTPGTEPR